MAELTAVFALAFVFGLLVGSVLGSERAIDHEPTEHGGRPL